MKKIAMIIIIIIIIIIKSPKQSLVLRLIAFPLIIIIIISFCNTWSCSPWYASTIGPMILECDIMIDLCINFYWGSFGYNLRGLN